MYTYLTVKVQGLWHNFVASNCFENIILRNSKFDQNCKVVEGKGDEKCSNVHLDIEGETKLEVLDSHFSNCYGGGGYSGGLNIDIHVYQSTLNVSVYITSSTFSNNSGTQGGGNMRIMNKSRGTTTLLFCIQIYYNSSFSDGYADNGGGLYAKLGTRAFFNSPSFPEVEEQCYCSISSTSFKGNIGGGLYISHLSLNLLDVTFLENNAEGSGGGVHVEHYEFSFKTITFTNTSFIRNRAREGGGVYAKNNYAVYFLGSTFSGNMAVLDGGGINVYHVSINILIRCYFENNKEKTTGGAIST